MLVLCSYDVGHVLREDTARRLRSEYKRAYLILSGGCKVTGVDALNLLLEEYIDVKALEEEKKKEEAANKEIEGKEEETKVLQKNSQAQKLQQFFSRDYALQSTNVVAQFIFGHL